MRSPIAKHHLVDIQIATWPLPKGRICQGEPCELNRTSSSIGSQGNIQNCVSSPNLCQLIRGERILSSISELSNYLYKSLRIKQKQFACCICTRIPMVILDTPEEVKRCVESIRTAMAAKWNVALCYQRHTLEYGVYSWAHLPSPRWTALNQAHPEYCECRSTPATQRLGIPQLEGLNWKVQRAPEPQCRCKHWEAQEVLLA